MIFRRSVIVVSACGFLVACATPHGLRPQAGAGSATVKVDSADAEQEALYAASMGRGGLTVRVNSNGCTRKEDFQVQVLQGYPAPTVIFKRIRPDRCRALVAGGVDLAFSFAELGIEPTSPISLANPLEADPTPGR